MAKRTDWFLLSLVVLAVFAGAIASFFFSTSRYFAAVSATAFTVYLFYLVYKFQVKLLREVEQFVEAARYADFSRNMVAENSSVTLNGLRAGFNEINKLFKNASKEKERQYHYLQKVLEMIDTGILSYESESGEVVWMNESLKNMLQLSYLKNVHSFANRDVTLYQQIVSLKPDESKIGTIHVEKKSYKVLLSATAFQTEGKRFQLIAFQNINEALDETESKAWQKLLSVLTHEIMNSIAPISSLAETLKTRLASIDKDTLTNGSFSDLETGVDTIKRRSESLIRFAETYRNLSKISQPNLSRFYVRDLFEDLFNLMQPSLIQKDIELDIVLKDPNLVLEADRSLIEQVLINLLVNSIDAVKNAANPLITLRGDVSGKSRVVIKVSDNGSGIPSDLLESVFIPFFSTKKSGSGIGLTLCKQIMMLHKGNIQVQSKEGAGTILSLEF